MSRTTQEAELIAAFNDPAIESVGKVFHNGKRRFFVAETLQTRGEPDRLVWHYGDSVGSAHAAMRQDRARRVKAWFAPSS